MFDQALWRIRQGYRFLKDSIAELINRENPIQRQSCSLKLSPKQRSKFEELSVGTIGTKMLLTS